MLKKAIVRNKGRSSLNKNKKEDGNKKVEKACFLGRIQEGHAGSSAHAGRGRESDKKE